MRRHIDVYSEFMLCRYASGVKLVPPEYFVSGQKRELFVKPIKPIAEIMQMPLSIFFFAKDFKIKDINEFCCASHGIYSKRDIVGYTMAKIANHQQEATKIHRNNIYVIEKNQFCVIEESFNLSDGSSVQTVSFKMPWFTENDEIAGIFGCAVSIDPQKLGNIAQQLSTISNMLLPISEFPHALITKPTIGGEHFSSREIDVIQLVMRGKTMREIGVILGLKTRTVEGYFADIKMKVGVNKKSEFIERMMTKAEW